MRKKWTFILVFLSLSVFFICGLTACKCTSCGKKVSTELTEDCYYLYDNEEHNPNIWLQFGKERWQDNKGDDGAYDKTGEKIILYADLAKEEAVSHGYIRNGVITIYYKAETYIFCLRDVTPPKNDKTHHEVHEWSEWKTSTVCNGETAYSFRYCIVCQFMEIQNSSSVIHPHDFELEDPVAPTCTKSGIAVCFRCKNCGYTVSKEAPALGHLLNDEYHDDGARHYRICQRENCGEKVYERHIYSCRIDKNPTCHENGSYTLTCKDCGHKETKDIAARHIWDNGRVISEPVCGAEIKILYTCTVCGERRTESNGTYEHDWGDWTVTKQATCTQNGEETHACKRCGEEEHRQTPFSHKFGDWITVKEYTCFEDGIKKHACTLCGFEEEDTVPAKHTFNDGVVIKQPTCTEDGIKELTCIKCGEKNREDIPALKHDTKTVEELAPTCTTVGFEITVCKRCGEYDYKIFDKLGHKIKYEIDDNYHRLICTRQNCNYSEHREDHDLKCVYDCINDGTQYFYKIFTECDICGYKKQIGETAHIHYGAEIIDEIPATCTESGWTFGLKCAVIGCKEVFFAPQEIPALGHDFEKGICKRCGECELELTLSSDGSYYIVSGIGDFKGGDLEIPSKYRNKPVLEIGESAFSGCYRLMSVVIPNSITTIGGCAFIGCRGLTSIKIPNSVTSIGNSAFSGCSSLTSIEIPNSVTTIGNFAFDECSGLTSINVDKNNPVYHSKGNCLIETQSKTLILGCRNSIIPNDGSVTSIGEYAFSECSGLTSIEIPNSVTTIGYQAFHGCSGLTSIEISNSVTTIGYWTFSGCSGLTSIEIPNSVTMIGVYAFEDCRGLTSITVDKNNPVYHSKGNCLIEAQSKALVLGCQNSVIPDDGSVTSIGGGAFAGCSGLTSIEIPNSVTSIGGGAFERCNNLKFNEYDNGLYLGNESDPYYALIEGKSKDITSCIINENTKIIAGSAFARCSGLTSIEIPNSVTSIGGSAFARCSGLTSIEIPNGVTSIGDGAFSGCSGLTSVTIGNSVTSIGRDAFSGCSGLTSVVIPDSVKTIGRDAFRECSGLTSVIIGNGVTTIGYWAFLVCSGLKNIYYSGDISNWCKIDGLDNIMLLERTLFINDEELTGELVIPDNVTSIGSCAFSGCSGLTSIEIPNSVKTIGEYAFWDCSGLTSITFKGTKEEWNAIHKGHRWNSDTGNYTVHCMDGDISK